MDLAKFLDLYLTEGREHVSLIRKGLPAAGKVSAAAVNDLFRHAHSLKGMAASMGFEATADLSHKVESLFNRWREGQEADAGELGAVVRAVDLLDASMDAVQRDGSEAVLEEEIREACEALLGGGAPAGPSGAGVANPPAGVESAAAPAPASRDLTVRLKVAIDTACPLPAARLMVVWERVRAEVPEARMEPDLERVMKEGLRLASFLLPPGSGLKELALAVRGLSDVAEVDLETPPAVPASRGSESQLVQSLRVPAEDLDELRDQASELLYRLNQFEAGLGPEERRRHRFWLESERSQVTRLFDHVLSIRLVSFEVLVERLGRTAREVSGRLGKPASFAVAGVDERVDRGLLERLLDPLVHLVRNAVDHGLEPVARRRELGKPEEGNIRLEIARDSESLLITVEDDGRGIDVEAIRQAAVDKGLYSTVEAAALDRATLMDLLTRPAFTTRREVTEVSGRGVGLDVVRSAVESLGGHLEMESEKGKGSRFTLVIPSATTLTRVLVFGWDDGVRYGLPASQIRRIYPLSSFPLVWSGSDRFLQAGEELLPVLKWRPGPVGREGAALRIMSKDRDRVLLVSQLFQGERVVVMPWGHPLEMVSEWMGGALLSTGELAYVLDGRVLVKREGD
jgi:two-component system, chemotaxis family, sensor kinase CheA